MYVRFTVDGIPKEASTRRQWDINRWDQKEGKAIGTREDVKTLNAFLESLTTKVNSYKTELFNKGIPVSSVDLINFINGRSIKRNKVLEEFLDLKRSPLFSRSFPLLPAIMNLKSSPILK